MMDAPDANRPRGMTPKRNGVRGCRDAPVRNLGFSGAFASATDREVPFEPDPYAPCGESP